VGPENGVDTGGIDPVFRAREGASWTNPLRGRAETGRFRRRRRGSIPPVSTLSGV